jgi:hypothetical protein
MSKKVLITDATVDTGRSEALVAQGAEVVVGDLSDINSICIRRSPEKIWVRLGCNKNS